MPKIVDHEARRRELAEAVWRVISNEGPHRASVRAVAAESGWSTGSLRHYFPTQDALLLFAMELLTERVRARVAEVGEREPRPLLRRICCELLPLTEPLRVEAEVWLAMVSRAHVDPALRQAERAARGAMSELFTSLLRHAADTGALAATRDVELESLRLLALTDGLVMAALFDPERADPASQLAALDQHLDDLLDA
ncbi:TetR/AcrR family transcriptional regulator [Kutzneria viridogrisea]|uniref:HTH tetR-type domain-containing protein n=2 Tax=Kutzneria TaxID=43356 RepID=W5WA32_9PSEU|nr:TetR family transcriptional regulator C-terminal domain-containing protein [Kutzneria albida]AHH95064.1 hypothetical protein KALB_1692 [Kutzneria albida DSM 43870]MBA8927579.1 AcrR family transcriptional regulator [Kutzneria viridogrisea]